MHASEARRGKVSTSPNPVNFDFEWRRGVFSWRFDAEEGFARPPSHLLAMIAYLCVPDCAGTSIRKGTVAIS
jgi:hypothetical protein